MTEGKTALSSKADMIGGYLPWRHRLLKDADKHKDKIEARRTICSLYNRPIQALFVGPAGSPLGAAVPALFAIVDPN